MSDKNNAEKLIAGVPDDKLLEFLKKALDKQQPLRDQFIAFKNDLEKKDSLPAAADPESIILMAFKEFKQTLESLDFDNMDWRKYIPRHNGYIEDYEAWENFADDHIDEIFRGWESIICEQIQQGELVEPICTCLGLYDATRVVQITGSENIFEDLTTHLLDHHQQMMNEVNVSLAGIIGIDSQYRQTIDAVLGHFQKNFQNEPGFLKYMEPTLLLLTESAAIASYVSEQFKINGIDERIVPLLALKIASFDEDKLIWREKAEEYMDLDLKVAIQLLDHYWTDDPVCFKLVGQKLFREHQAELCNYFSELLFPMFDEPFYIEVLFYKTLRDHDIELYMILREYLSGEERDRFVEKITFDEEFKVRVLSIEKRYPEILQLVQKNALNTWHFTEMITPILNIYPSEVFGLIRLKCEDTLRNYKKRSGYSRIAKWLRLSLEINGKEDDARNLVNELYNRKPALPALKEEIRKAGVVG